MAIRILVLTFCFVAASAYIASASKTEPVFTREPLANLPMQIGEWRGREAVVDERVVSVLAVDDYLSREYLSSARSIGLYVGFYQSQRQGNTIHSPMNCLPGSGWNPVERTYITVPVALSGSAPSRGIQINRIIIEKGLDRDVVLYWYQAHGRVVASEYWGKIYTVLDAMRINRTDGAMVRVISPITASDPQHDQEAEREGIRFVQSIFPLLSRYLPE
jgi:EpsI family protein